MDVDKNSCVLLYYILLTHNIWCCIKRVGHWAGWMSYYTFKMSNALLLYSHLYSLKILCALKAYNFEVHISISVYCWASVLDGKKKLTQYVSIISRSYRRSTCCLCTVFRVRADPKTLLNTRTQNISFFCCCYTFLSLWLSHYPCAVFFVCFSVLFFFCSCLFARRQYKS